MAQAENGAMKVRQPKVRKSKEITEEERIAAEKAEKKAEKLEDIERMLRVFSQTSAITSYSHKRSVSCAKSVQSHLRSVGNTPGSILFEHYSKVGLDISNTLAAHSMAMEAIRKLDGEIKSMRMNPWKKNIVKIRAEMFDELHADQLLITDLNTQFGKVAEMQP